MLSTLSPRERIALLVGGIAILSTVLYFGIISPYRTGTERLDRKIDSRQAQLQEVQSMSHQYRQLQQQMAAAQKGIDQGGAFSLFSVIEGIANRIVGRENLVYMRPQPAIDRDGFREESVEIKVERIALDQFVEMLFEIESVKAYLQVKNLRLKTRFDDRNHFDAVLTIASYGRGA